MRINVPINENEGKIYMRFRINDIKRVKYIQYYIIESITLMCGDKCIYKVIPSEYLGNDLRECKGRVFDILLMDCGGRDMTMYHLEVEIIKGEELIEDIRVIRR